MSYKQLIEGQRYQIQAYLYQGLSYRLVAQKMGVSHSSISREIKRNHLSKSYYDPKQAHVKAIKRRQGADKYRVSTKTQELVKLGLSFKWSPEQISGVSRLIGKSVSHGWIYNFIQAEKALNLRPRKCLGSQSTRSGIGRITPSGLKLRVNKWCISNFNSRVYYV